MEPEAAREDRISLEIGPWRFLGDDAAFELGLMQLASFSRDGQGSGSRIFSGPQGRRGGHRKVSIARQRPDVDGPLFAGWLAFKRQPNDQDWTSYDLSAHLALNPTRAFVARPLNERSASPSPALPQPNIFRMRPHNPGSIDEFSLTGEDNVILTPRHHLAARDNHWSNHRDGYLRAVDEFIDRVVMQCFNGDGANLRRVSAYNLKSVEVYWDDLPLSFSSI